MRFQATSLVKSEFRDADASDSCPKGRVRRAKIPGLLTIILLVLSLNANAQQPPKKVLILTGSDPNHPGFSIITRKIAATLRDRSSVRVELLYELQQGLVTPPQSPESDHELAVYLKRKYDSQHIDLILAMVAPRLRILIEEEPGLFPNVPKVFYDYESEREATNRSLGPNVTGVWATLDLDKTLDLAFTLEPSTQRVVVVSGVGSQEQPVRESAQLAFRSFENRAEFVYVTGEPLDELRLRLAALPKDSIVVFLTYSTDRMGHNYSGPEVLSLIAPGSSAPIYGNTGTLMGLGIVGGNLLNFEATGDRIGQIGLRVLAGERPEQIPQETAPREMAVDWREMQRWKISEASLPAGTIVHFRQPTFWEQYKWYVVATIFAFVIESLLIVWLVINDRRRRRAEREQERFALLAESEHVRLDEVVSNVPGIVWETRLEPGTNLIKTTFISDFLKRMLGYTPEEWLSLPPNVGFNIIPEEDREGAIRDCEAVMASGKEGISQYRLTTKDGRIVWVESHQSPIFDEHKTVVGLRGVTLDVSERKLAEDAQRESESRFRNMADSAPVMIWISGSDRQCIYVNQQWLDFTGRTMEQEVGEGWTAGVHPDDYARGREIYGAAFDAKETFNFEYRLRRADGVFRWVFVTGTPRLSETGELLGYVGSCIDITERKESEVALRTALEEVSHLKNQLQEENIYLQEEIKLEQNFGEIVGQSDALKYVLFKIEQVAPTETTVLITGETGTGKELVARAIHSASARRDRPLVKVNCAALAPSLIESEFFGHEKGAFTGAGARKIGRFELANGATIFLDEIGELPTELQVKLLRVIQEGELERLGGTKTIKVDVRIIAATNRHLEEDVKQGLFREDLWYRLNVFPITVPPLRQRREDIPLLVEHFARSFSTRLGKLISSVAPVTMNSLRDHPWPGNVRELANVIERAVINSQGSVLRVSEDFVKNAAETPSALNKTLEEIERDHISRILEDRGWRIEGQNGAARILGMNPSTLRTRMAKLGVHKPSHSLSKSTN